MAENLSVGGDSDAAGGGTETDDSPTREQLIREIKNEFRKFDRNLTENEFGWMAPRELEVYLDEFDDFETIIRVAGREASTPSKDDLKQEVRRLEEELGRIPNSTDMDKHGRYKYAQCREKFGSWGDTLEAAGYDRLNSRAEHPSREQLIDELHRLNDAFDSRPTVDIVSEESPYAPSEFRREFGTFTDALAAAGIEGRKSATNKELLEDAKRVDEMVDGRLKTTHIEKHGKFSPSTYVRRWDGGFPEVLLEIGYSEDELPTEFSEFDVIDEVARLMDKYGEDVPVTRFKEEADMSLGVLYKHFDKWSDTKDAAREAETRWNV